MQGSTGVASRVDRIDSYQYHMIFMRLCVVNSDSTNAPVVCGLLLKRSSVGTQVRSDFAVLQVGCYCVRFTRNQQEMKNICLGMGGDRLQKMMRLCWVGATAAQSQISPSYTHLFQSLSFSAWVSVTLCSDQDCLLHLSHPWLCSGCL